MFSRPINGGLVLLRRSHYRALVDSARRPEPERLSTPAGNPLSAAVAAITARQAGIRHMPDADRDATIRLLAILAGSMLDATTDDRGAEMLRALGLEATDEFWHQHDTHD